MTTTRRAADTKSGKVVSSQRRDKLGSSKKADVANKQPLITGWNLPLLQDENDIVSWMSREKNGDNIKKPRHDEEVPEEQYRHLFSRCKNVENQMEFERESLHERYRKHCQFGSKLAEVRVKPQPITKTPRGKNGELSDIPERTLAFPRSCKSAEPPATPKVSVSRQVGLDDDALESLLPSRSHSVIDDTKLRAYGLTLPPDEKTARLLELAGKFIAKAEMAAKTVKKGNDDLQDEGYGSKGSSNDAELPDDDAEGSKIAHCDTASVYTNLDSIVADQNVVMEEIAEGLDKSDITNNWNENAGNSNGGEILDNSGMSAAQDENGLPRSHGPVHNMDARRDAIAKLMYSRRDRNVYERLPSRRMRNKEFRYAGKEQSRLMETSLNQVTPGYLNMHQFANLSNFMQYANTNHPLDITHQQLQHQHIHSPQQLPQQQTQEGDTQQPKAVVLTRISLQDSSGQDNTSIPTDGHSQPNGHHNFEQFTGSTPLTGSPINRSQLRVRSGKGGASGRLQRSNSAKRYNQSPAGDYDGTVLGRTSDKDKFSQNTDKSIPERRLHVNNVRNPQNSASNNTPAYIVNGGKTTYGASYPHPVSNQSSTMTSANTTKDTLTVQSKDSARTAPSLSPVPMDSSRTIESNCSSQQGDKTYSTTCFPVADLLPAVERNLRRRGILGMGKQQTLYRSHTSLDPLSWKQQLGGPGGSAGSLPPSTASCQDLYSSSLLTANEEAGRSRRMVRRDGRMPAAVPLIIQQKSNGPPGFRPHNSLSPLQRAKEIATRRLHGHVTQFPDGSEAVRVTSPQYQTSKMDRINSASRQLGRIISGTWKQQ